jgi:L-arabinose isomerase
MDKHPLRVGLFGIGLEAYWPQFEGLKPRREGYLGQVAQKLGRPGVEVCNLGLIDSPEKAMEAGHAFRRADVDIIFLHVTTYALSSTVLPVVQRAKVPVIILNLQPVAALDYKAFNRMGDRTKMTGEWLAHCGARCHFPGGYIRSGDCPLIISTMPSTHAMRGSVDQPARPERASRSAPRLHGVSTFIRRKPRA